MAEPFPHQRRFFALLPSVDRDVLVRVNRYVDGVMSPTGRSELGVLWRPIADDVCDRIVLIEHFCDTVSHARYQSALAKLDEYAVKHWSMVGADRPSRPPILVIVAYKAIGELVDSLENTETPGIYRSSRIVEHILIVATELPPNDAMLTPLRLCTRVPKDEATEIELVQYLLADKQLSTLEKETLMERIMETTRATSSETFQEICERFAHQLQREKLYQSLEAQLAELKANQQRAEEERQLAEARLEEERQRAEEERQRAEEERQRAEEERQRAEARLEEERQRADTALREREADRARYEQDIADLRRRLADDGNDG